MAHYKLATAAQKDYIRKLNGGSIGDYTSSRGASKIIDDLIENPVAAAQSPAHEFFKTHKKMGANKETALERAKFGLFESEKSNMIEALNDVYGE